jgi:probable HAF family extracellular repeat protein
MFGLNTHRRQVVRRLPFLAMVGTVALGACDEMPNEPQSQPNESVAELLANPAPSYRVTELGTFLPTAVNEHGRVAGNQSVPGGQHAVFWRDGILVDLGTLGGTHSLTLSGGLNKHDVVVGMSMTADGVWHGFLWDGTMRDLGPDFIPRVIDDAGRMVGSTPQGVVLRSGDSDTPLECGPLGLNNHRQVVGNYLYDTPSGGIEQRACFWDDGVFHDLDLGWSSASDIDDKGLIVGSTGEELTQAFTWQDGTKTDLPTLGGSALANAVNDAGLVVGSSGERFSPEEDIMHPVTWWNGTITRLSEEFGGAVDVNDRGQIVGNLRPDNSTPSRAVMWTPAAK